MKKYGILALILGALVISGCSVLDQTYDKQVVWHDPVTNSISRIVTNEVVIPPVTNAAGNVIAAHTNVVLTPVTEYIIVPGYSTTNLVDKPLVTGAIGTVQALPFPYTGLAGGVLALLYSFYRNIRNKKALVAVVQGIDEGRKLLQNTPELQAIDSKIKDILIKHQEVAGVLNAVTAVVNTYTDDTVPPKT